MWWIMIIVVLIVFFFYSFFSEKEKLMQKVDKEGGMQEKYAILLSYFMSVPGAKITSLSRDNIQFIAKSEYLVNHFSILQTFTDIIITWQANSVIGEFKDEWKFPPYLDQNEMANKMIQDMEFKIKNFADPDELTRRINKAMDELEE